jgi:hypothetical protein
MPYQDEFARKTTQSEFLKNPDVEAFLGECSYLKPPSDEEAEQLASKYNEPPIFDGDLPEYVISVDGSNHESSIDDKLPSTKVGYIKIGAILISLEQFGSLREGKFVDPFRVAELKDKNTSLTFSLPSANIRWGDKDNVRDSFRAILDKQFLSANTRFEENNYYSSLRSTLFHLASRRPGEMNTGDPFKLKIHKCPDCGRGPIEVEDIEEQQYCSFCRKDVYPTDCLRLWEEVNNYQSNQVVISRLMLILEHLIPIHYMRYFNQKAYLNLTRIAFFIDGPLAIFGNAAWMHRSIMIFIEEINQKLARKGQPPLLVIGLQKTGQVIDHVTLIDKFLPKNRLFAIEDDYRYKYILSNRDPARKTFGFETYYGQDFIFKTATNRKFVFGLPYSFPSKDNPGINFPQEKVKWEHYPHLAKAVKLINHLESDLFKNAVVPIALAHRYTAISLQPGGKVLDILTRRSLES